MDWLRHHDDHDHDTNSEGVEDDFDPLGPCDDAICITGQVIIAVLAVAFIVAFFFAPVALKGKVRFMAFWFFGHFLNCVSVLAIARGDARMLAVPWPTLLWLIVSFCVSFIHLAWGPRKENFLFLLSFIPAVALFIYVAVIGVGELCAYIVHWIIIPAVALLHCYYLLIKGEGKGTDPEDGEGDGVREVSTVSPLDGFIGWALIWAMVGPWCALFGYSRLGNDDTLVFILIVVWLSFSLLFCLVVPIFIFLTFPKWQWFSVGALAFTIAGIVVFSIIFFVVPDAAVVLLLLNLMLYLVLFALRFIIPSGINKGGSINLTFHAIHLHFYGIYSSLCLGIWSLFVSDVVETDQSMAAWVFTFVWFSICCFALPFFHQMWANSQVRESQDGVWGETPGEEGGPSTREVLLGVWDKVLLCVPSVLFFIFFVVFFFISLFDDMNKGFAAGAYMMWFFLFTIPSVLYYGCSKISPRVFTIAKCALFGVAGLATSIFGLAVGVGALQVLIPWLVISGVLIVLSCVISLGWGC